MVGGEELHGRLAPEESNRANKQKLSCKAPTLQKSSAMN
jgi:hypothetical protein